LRTLDILRRRPCADSNSPYHRTPNRDRYATSNQHKPAPVRVVNPIRRPAWQEVLALVCGRRRAVASGGESLVDSDLDRRQLGRGHAREVQEVQRAVH